MSVFLIVLSVIAALIGFVTLSEATMGVGFMAGACLLGIFARIAQAAEHRKPEGVTAKPVPASDGWTNG